MGNQDLDAIGKDVLRRAEMSKVSRSLPLSRKTNERFDR